ncbi:TPA: hypothetical protein ACX6SQ_000435 [Photobacterium damselae]
MTTVLRYLTKEKLKWLLQDNGIYFGSSANQSDESEGIYDHTLFYKILNLSSQATHNPKFQKDIDNLQYDMMIFNQKNCFISSWYLGSNETPIMWEQYGKNGVAIVSHIDILRYDLPQPLNQATSFYTVEYDNDKKINSIKEPLKYKFEKFKFENEFRIVFDLSTYSICTGYQADNLPKCFIGGIPSHENPLITQRMSSKSIAESHKVITKKDNGHIIKYNLNQIIEKIIISPFCSDEEIEEIKSICNESDLTVPIESSLLRIK